MGDVATLICECGQARDKTRANTLASLWQILLGWGMDTDSYNFELDAVLNTLVDGLIMIDARGLITRYNIACESIFGYDPSEVIGKNIRCLMPEPYHSKHDDYIANYHATKKAAIIGIGRDVSGQRKDGTVFPMYLSVGEIRNVKGHAYVGIIRDLTETVARRRAFEQLQQEHFHLSRVSAMDQMGAAIAHELNQPLTAVMNYLDAGGTVLSRDDAIDRTRLATIMEKASGQAERAAKILARLRQFIETGDMNKKMVSIDTLIHGAIDLTMPQFKNNGISTHVDIEADLPDILVSDVQIQQVLVNLIRNACEAMVEQDTKTLRVTAKREDDKRIKIGVIDSGIGLSEADLKSLYEPFNSDKTGGLGVGLSISRSIIANHEGKLWAERNTPRGACFYFTLPLC